jgi:eukaryotic-like serine/threonine-protein kinase
MPTRVHVIFILVLLTCLTLSACGAPATTPPPAPTDTATPPPSPTLESTMNAHWTYQTGAAIWGSPTLNDGTLYIGSDDDSLYALDAQTGALKWKFASKGIVRSKPAIAGSLVFFTSDDGFLYAVNTSDGTKAWTTDIGNFYEREDREAFDMNSPTPTGYDYVQSSPVVADGTVFAGSLDGKLYALAADTGVVQWTFTTTKKIRGSAAVDNGIVYFGSWDKLMYAVDAKTGEAKWATGVGGEVQSTPLVANGMVYTASRKASVVALDALTGEQKWEHIYGSNMWVESSPSLAGNAIYIGSSGSKIILGLDALTGTPTAFYSSKDFHWSTPLVLRDRLYIGGASPVSDPSGGMYSLKIEDGKFNRDDPKLQVFSTPTTMEFTNSWIGIAGSPITENNFIYFGSLDGKVYAINALP